MQACQLSACAAVQDAAQRQVAAPHELPNGLEFGRAQWRASAQRVLLGGTEQRPIRRAFGETIATHRAWIVIGRDLLDV